MFYILFCCSIFISNFIIFTYKGQGVNEQMRCFGRSRSPLPIQQRLAHRCQGDGSMYLSHNLRDIQLHRLESDPPGGVRICIHWIGKLYIVVCIFGSVFSYVFVFPICLSFYLFFVFVYCWGRAGQVWACYWPHEGPWKCWAVESPEHAACHWACLPGEHGDLDTGNWESRKLLL